MNRLQANRRLRRLLGSLALGITAMLCAWSTPPATAQPAEESPETQESPSESVAESGEEPSGVLGSEGASSGQSQPPEDLEIFYLLDEHGNLVPVPSLSFEEFERLYRDQQGLAQARPEAEYSLEEIAATIEVADSTAQASIRFQIRCTGEGWTRVPLGLPEMLLAEVPVYEGEGKFFLRYEEDSGGYVAWLHGSATAEHQLVLSMQSQIEERGPEWGLRFSVPRATRSTLTTTVDSPQARLISLSGATLAESESAETQPPRWEALGLEGEVELLWRDGGVPEEQSTGVLDIETNLLVSVESQGNGRFNLNYLAHLEIRSYGDTVEQFTVALPAGSSLVASESPNYRAVQLAEGASPTGGPLVQITLPRSTAGPVHIDLEAEQVVEEPNPEHWLSVGGFQVLEAARQSGFVALSVQDDWQVRWRTGEGDPTVRRVEDLPEVLAADSVVVPFAFDSQPFLLEIRVFERQTQKRVEPIYIVTIQDRELLLDARLQYEIREGKARYLDIDMRNWELKSLGPSDVVKEGLLTSEDQTVIIQLLQATTGEFELQLTARQQLPSVVDEVTFTVPHPVVNPEGAATVIVLAGDQLSLAPTLERMVGWSPDVMPPGLELPQAHGEPLVYRLDKPKEASPFSAVVQRRTRETSVELRGLAHVDDASLEVDQTLRYSVRYEPISELPMRVPAGLSDTTLIEWRLDGKLLETGLAPVDGDQSGEIRDYILPLPTPQVGSFELTAHFILPRQAETEEQNELRVPLIVPRDGATTRNEFVISSPNSVGVQLNDNRWQRATARAAPGELLLMTNSTPSWVALIATPLQAAAEEVRIDRMWHQTWLASSTRRERVVFRLESEASELRVELPDTAALEQTPWISVDGFSVQAAGDSAGAWVVPLESREGSAVHVVEIVYEFERAGGPGLLSIVSPRIEGSSGPYRMYWELVSQPGEMLLAAPAGMTDEANWHWGYLTVPLVGELPYPTRSPGWSQAEVESWIGATDQARPPAGANRYLLSTFDEPAELQIRTASRAKMVLLVSAVVLGLGLLFMYYPRLFNLKLLFALGVAVAALGYWHPPTALQIARMAALGVAMLILARVLLGLLTWQRRPAVLGSTSGDSESRRTYLGPSIEEAGSGQTTATAPAALAATPLSPAESSR